MVRRTTAFFPLFALLIAPASRAQSTAPAFDVASVKPNLNCSSGPGGRASLSPHNLALPCVTLRALIRLAYGDVLVGGGLGARLTEVTGGPGWLDTERYDILAKSEGTAQSAGPMLQTLLEERFQLKIHKEGKDSPAYILSVAKGGAKLKVAEEGSCVAMDLTNLQPPAPPKPGKERPHYCGMGAGRSSGSLMVTDWYGTSMAELAGRMLGNLELPVVDQTNLAERYDIHLEYVPERRGPVMLNGVPAPDLAAPAADPTEGPSIFSAVEKQLGLKLSKGTARLDVIVVDRAQKPSAN